GAQGVAMPRFAANLTMLWPDLDVYDRFRAAAEAGFRRVEILFVHALDPARVEKSLQDLGLELVLFDPAPGDWARGERGLLSVPGREQEFVATVRDAVAAARRFGTRLLNALVGIPPAGVSRAEGERTAIANLRAAIPLVEHTGVTLLVEAINSIDMPGGFARTVERAAYDLAGGGERQLSHELDDARVFVRGESRADVLLQLGFQRLSRREAFLQDDHCLHRFGADGVGLAHDSGQRDGGVAREAGLDLAGADA